MAVNILMPALSPTMEKGKLAKWLKKLGDTVKSGDVLAEIETDKATMEVEAVDEGILSQILVPEGTEDVAVNTPIAIIMAEGEKPETLAPPPAMVKPASPETALSATAQKLAAPAPITPNQQISAISATGRLFATPLARRIAKLKGIALSSLKGTGPQGRIIVKDIETAPAHTGNTSGNTSGNALGTSPRPTFTPPLGASDHAVMGLFEIGTYDLIPHDSMRKTIARRLTEAKQTIPHFYVTMDCALDQLLALRERLNAQAPLKEGKALWKISVNDFIIKAMAMALIKVPHANVSWTENAMIRHHHADVGVAVSIPGGLITPVVRQAELKGLAQISMEMKDYAARAKLRKLKPDEYMGGSTSVSNLGMLGVKSFAAIVNPPQATILAVGAGEKRPVVVGSEIVVQTQMSVTLSTDHRCVDGALGAELLGQFKSFIEEPGLMLV